MAIRWHWDQGRATILDFSNVLSIARVLTDLNGCPLYQGNADPLARLRTETEAPFATPADDANYRIWRQYSRVFRQTLLATEVNGHLRVTGLCRRLADQTNGPADCDSYLLFLIPRLYMPSPAFTSGQYDPEGDGVFPMCALLRFLIAQFKRDGHAAISISDIFSRLIGNDARGDEALNVMVNMPASGYQPESSDKRQVREMVKFFSQLSFLSWDHGEIHLDVPGQPELLITTLLQQATPIEREREEDRDQEILALGRVNRLAPPPEVIYSDLPSEDCDVLFTEGRRNRRTHLVVERSARLRALFFERRRPRRCDVCGCNTKLMYPWTTKLFELHHLLPLSSPARVKSQGTSLDDIRAVCPTCHKAIHLYYRKWLNQQGAADFAGVEEAARVYNEAKDAVVLVA